jgi:hypothetical protein
VCGVKTELFRELCRWRQNTGEVKWRLCRSGVDKAEAVGMFSIATGKLFDAYRIALNPCGVILVTDEERPSFAYLTPSEAVGAMRGDIRVVLAALKRARPASFGGTPNWVASAVYCYDRVDNEVVAERLGAARTFWNERLNEPVFIWHVGRDKDERDAMVERFENTSFVEETSSLLDVDALRLMHRSGSLVDARLVRSAIRVLTDLVGLVRIP